MDLGFCLRHGLACRVSTSSQCQAHSIAAVTQRPRDAAGNPHRIYASHVVDRKRSRPALPVEPVGQLLTVRWRRNSPPLSIHLQHGGQQVVEQPIIALLARRKTSSSPMALANKDRGVHHCAFGLVVESRYDVWPDRHANPTQRGCDVTKPGQAEETAPPSRSQEHDLGSVARIGTRLSIPTALPESG